MERLRRLVLATSGTPLRHLWILGYSVARRLVARRLADSFGASVYARGSTGSVVPGLSDIDLVVIRPDGGIGERSDTVRSLAGLVQSEVLGQAETEAIAGSTYWTFGLESGGAAYHGASIVDDPVGLLDRPGIPPEPGSWKHVAGPELVLPPLARDRQAVREAAWCELVTWWRFAFRAIVRETAHPSDPYLCVKLVADPLRVLLALRGRPADRAAALRLGPSLMPELANEIGVAAALLAGLHRRPPADFAAALPALLAVTARVAVEIAAELPAGETVRLVGGDARDRVPLADWRALVAEGLPCAALEPVERDPRDLDDLRDACRAESPDTSVIVSGDLMIEPTAHPFWSGRMRTVQAPFTDPVSSALLAGRAVATFPGVRGWCATDWARRAVTERLAWLTGPGGAQPGPRPWSRPPDHADPGPRTAAYLLAAERAARFGLSLAGGEPELRLDARTVAEESGAAAVVVLERLERDEDPREADVEALKEGVLRRLRAAAEALGPGNR